MSITNLVVVGLLVWCQQWERMLSAQPFSQLSAVIAADCRGICR
ncbi:hypothetical protein [Pseudomonas sp. TCU-HL1]|nr:hypothetical protein [Pseudomonas sp. TCU-HL1]